MWALSTWPPAGRVTACPATGGYRFPLEIISHAVWLYHRFALSFRDVEQRRYSDLAIETALTLRLLYHLPLRQAEGFLHALFGMMRLDLSAPDYTRRCCMNTRCGWGGVAHTSRDPPQEPHYGDEVEGSSQV